MKDRLGHPLFVWDTELVRESVDAVEAEPVTVLVRHREGVCETVKEEEGVK